MTGRTVFIIAVAYNQVIELFPSGGAVQVASACWDRTLDLFPAAR